MPYVIAEPCIGTKNAACVEVCPVDCIHPAPGEPGFEEAAQLFIHPAECIECSACVEECPVDACFDAEDLPEQWQGFAERNAEYFVQPG